MPGWRCHLPAGNEQPGPAPNARWKAIKLRYLTAPAAETAQRTAEEEALAPASHRNFLLPAGRGLARRPADRVRPPDRLPAALHLVRHHHSFTGGEPATVESVLAEVAKYPARQVCVTGGEPLSQKECLPLLDALCDAGYDVSLETSGRLDVADVDPRVARIMDLKAPDSGESGENRWSNLAHLKRRAMKSRSSSPRAVITEWAREQIRSHRQIDAVCPVLFRPPQGLIEAGSLAELDP